MNIRLEAFLMHLFLNLQKTSLQDDLINRVVLYLLEDDDIRVRQASAKCLARYGHMITSPSSLQEVFSFSLSLIL